MGLTKKHRTKIQVYVDELRSHIALLDWRIIVEEEFDVDDSNAASIRCIYGTRHAFLSISETFDEHTIEQQRQFLVHELLHCHLNRIKVSMINTFNELGREAFEQGKAQLIDEVEYAVD